MALPAAAVVGIDVGEDFLDLAVLDAAARNLRFARVAIAGLEQCSATPAGSASDGRAASDALNTRGAISEMGRRLLAAAPELGVIGTIALIDSPRWPRDFDRARPRRAASAQGATARVEAGRAIDQSLREIVGSLALTRRDGAPFRLSLFPTPKLEYFAACASDPGCKPHLVSIARDLFGTALEGMPRLPVPMGGRVFTRFMLAGFATYQALLPSPVECFEAYPDLAFRVWARGEYLPPKSAARAALDARKRISQRLSGELGCIGASRICTLDEADAAVLALSAGRAMRTGAIAVIEWAGEGRFALALDRDQARQLPCAIRKRS